MKRDGRTLDHKTLEEIRLMAVQRVWEGEQPSVVIASYGFARPVIYRWLREARGKGRGLRALRSRKGTGRPRRLAPKQEQQVFRWINGKDPRQHGFDFGLWTRLVVRKLIADKFGVNFGVTAVGKLLAKLGLTPQKPLKRAYERDQNGRSSENTKPRSWIGMQVLSAKRNKPIRAPRCLGSAAMVSMVSDEALNSRS
jgi:transposase